MVRVLLDRVPVRSAADVQNQCRASINASLHSATSSLNTPSPLTPSLHILQCTAAPECLAEIPSAGQQLTGQWYEKVYMLVDFSNFDSDAALLGRTTVTILRGLRSKVEGHMDRVHAAPQPPH
ncbi:hypothetical protein B0H14DRAFT_2558354 [Mycena olivaceomarginata]|nr:hypothetical protein B0H14DRAFT_2558354 [Mycena olivaceomarginata]